MFVCVFVYVRGGGDGGETGPDSGACWSYKKCACVSRDAGAGVLLLLLLPPAELISVPLAPITTGPVRERRRRRLAVKSWTLYAGRPTSSVPLRRDRLAHTHTHTRTHALPATSRRERALGARAHMACVLYYHARSSSAAAAAAASAATPTGAEHARAALVDCEKFKCRLAPLFRPRAYALFIALSFVAAAAPDQRRT
jgi:hypothetical protein